MNKLISIDVSESKYAFEDDLIKIILKDGNQIEVSFLKLVSLSKYFRNKYNYCEAVKLVPEEFNKIEEELQISIDRVKLFIQLIQNEKVDIPIEWYNDFYILSNHFVIPKFIEELEDICKQEIFNIDLAIQILTSEKLKSDLEMKLSIKIEEILSERINECFENEKFKELPIHTIHRIVCLNEKGKRNINHDLLSDFIFESLNGRFLLIEFVEFDKLNVDKFEQFTNLIEKEDDSSQIFIDFILSNRSFYKRMKSNYDETQDELKQSKIREEQANEEVERARNEICKMKNKMKIFVGGYDDYNQLGKEPNSKYGIHKTISTPEISNFDLSKVLSFSVYCQHGVIVTNDGKLKGIGYNSNGRIMNSLPESFKDFVEFSIEDPLNRSLTPVSACCGCQCTLYLFSEINSSHMQLVFCDECLNQGSPVFLNTVNVEPIALFGGCKSFAAIGRKREVIFFKSDSIKKSPESPIKAAFLPDGEKASSVAISKDSVFVLSSNGHVFSSVIANELNFVCVDELKEYKIVELSGTFEHCFAVSDDGLVFGCGSNKYGKLGIGQGKDLISSFEKISSLEKYKIRAAYAGCDFSLFETQEGKVLSCGCSIYGQLLIKEQSNKLIYLPTETTIDYGASFCISGNCVSFVFIGGGPPPNTPNIRI